MKCRVYHIQCRGCGLALFFIQSIAVVSHTLYSTMNCYSLMQLRRHFHYCFLLGLFFLVFNARQSLFCTVCNGGGGGGGSIPICEHSIRKMPMSNLKSNLAKAKINKKRPLFLSVNVLYLRKNLITCGPRTEIHSMIHR